MSNNLFDLTLEDEKGNLKSKEEILKELGDFYDSLLDSNQLSGKEYYEKITKPSNLLDLELVRENDNFFQRAIYINEEMNDELVQYVHQTIKFYNIIDKDKTVEERTPINIYINTCGGDTDCCLGICSSILTSTTPVYTWNIGKAYSSGFIILLCGTKRFGFKHSQYLFHLGYAYKSGDYHKFMDFADYYPTYIENNIKKLVLDHSKLTEDKFNSLIKDDWWFSSEEALSYGFIDEIADNII